MATKKQKREKRKLNKKMQKEIVARKKKSQLKEQELKSSNKNYKGLHQSKFTLI